MGRANKFNEEYTRLVGTKGGIDFNTGVFSYRPDMKKADRVGHSYAGVVDNTKLAWRRSSNRCARVSRRSAASSTAATPSSPASWYAKRSMGSASPR